jgi:hypothetical protein
VSKSCFGIVYNIHIDNVYGLLLITENQKMKNRLAQSESRLLDVQMRDFL